MMGIRRRRRRRRRRKRRVGVYVVI